jgi:hypothetical protein
VSIRGRWSIASRLALHRLNAGDLLGELRVRHINALGRSGQCGCLGAHIVRGLLVCGHLLLERVQGLELGVHGVQPLQDCGEDIFGLGARSRTLDHAHGCGSKT